MHILSAAMPVRGDGTHLRGPFFDIRLQAKQNSAIKNF